MSKLFLIPSPIGNLEDITIRAIRILKTVDFVLAEDTRTSGFLLKHLEIKKPLLPYHKFNEHKNTESIANRILLGESVALVSDAGTPGISDPGFLLVTYCIAHHIEVECLPGATAFVPALINSGLSCNRFCFEGFLPQKKGRKSRLNELKDEQRTMIFYESPHRLLKTLNEFSTTFGENRKASVSRELTKIYEENRRGTLGDLIAHFGTKPVKGELVIVVHGKSSEKKKKAYLKKDRM